MGWPKIKSKHHRYRCSKCGKYKRPDEFYKDQTKRNGLTSYCKVCQKECVNVYRRADPIKTRMADRKKELKKKYGITLEQYDEMFEAQGGICAICKESDITGKRLSIDHDHETGKVRGLLCGKCNTRIGVLENKKWRDGAEIYLYG